MKAIIIGGSKGIGNAIVNSLSELEFEIISPPSSELDSANIRQIKSFVIN